jgi:hypothetical protein
MPASFNQRLNLHTLLKGHGSFCTRYQSATSLISFTRRPEGDGHALRSMEVAQEVGTVVHVDEDVHQFRARAMV